MASHAADVLDSRGRSRGGGAASPLGEARRFHCSIGPSTRSPGGSREPDPVYASFGVTYDNSTGTTGIEATLVAPSVTFRSGAMQLGWIFAVDPPGSGLVPAGAIVTVTHEKVPGSGSGDGLGAPCDHCGAEGGFFEVDVDAGPWSVSLGEETGAIGCAM